MINSEVSGKMLRHNEERNLMGFKYSNRSIRIFPVFQKREKSFLSKKNNEEFKNRSFLSKDSVNSSERDFEELDDGIDGQNSEKIDIQ